MLRAVLIETSSLDESTLSQHLTALGETGGWRLEAQGERWLLWLDESKASERLCAALLACNWLRRLDFVA
jgi:DNA-binding transcriptional ArsR family regulator